MAYDILIIGGGISGLGLAHQALRRGLRPLVLERQAQVGGCIASHAFPECCGFWVEAGAHTCYNSYGQLLAIVDDLGLVEQLKPKLRVPFRLLRDGQLRSVASALHPLELAWCLPKMLWAPKAGRSVQNYYSEVLGRRNFADVLSAAFDAVICQPAAEFPADMLFRRKPRRKDRPRSFTLPGGLSTLPAALAAQPGLEVLTGQTITGVLREGEGFRLTTEAGADFSGRRLALAVPPDAAAALLTGTFPALAASLRSIGCADIDSVSVAVPRAALKLPPLAGIIAPQAAFYSMVARDYFADPSYRGFTFHFRPDRLSPDAQIAQICQILGVAASAIVGVGRRRNRLPALRADHSTRIAALDRVLAGSGLALTGNYFIGVSIEDCLTRAATEAQRLFGD